MRTVLQSRLATPTKRYIKVSTTQRRSYAKPAGKSAERFTQAKCYLSVSGVQKDHDVDVPARMKNLFKDIPAYDKWFTRTIQAREDLDQPRKRGKSPSARAMKQMENNKKVELNHDYLDQFGDTMVPLELTNKDALGRTEFKRFQGPLSEIMSYMGEKKSDVIAMPRLYLAQLPLDELPKPLQDDLPTPEILKIFGKGDIYASSLWMGKAPTQTPLHRDPNPNLFVQLAGKKTIRLMRPEVGRGMYERVRSNLYKKMSNGANMRGEEMMQGEEFDALQRAVWNDKLATDGPRVGIEVELKAGHGLYIPLGWWHAVKGTGVGPNASVSHEASIAT